MPTADMPDREGPGGRYTGETDPEVLAKRPHHITEAKAKNHQDILLICKCGWRREVPDMAVARESLEHVSLNNQ